MNQKIIKLNSFLKKKHDSSSKSALKLANKVPGPIEYWQEIAKMEVYAEIFKFIKLQENN